MGVRDCSVTRLKPHCKNFRHQKSLYMAGKPLAVTVTYHILILSKMKFAKDSKPREINERKIKLFQAAWTT